MLTRTLGHDGNKVSALGLGCWAIGGPFYRGSDPVGWGEVDDAESIQAIHRGLDLGITLFDTSNVYGAGHSEHVLGQALGSRRHEVSIATKFGNLFDETTKQITGADVSPARIRAACDASLQRLQTDYIDLYQLHTDPPADEIPGVLDALDGLITAGKIRGYGWSTDDPAKARRFAERQACTAVQFTLNVLEDKPAMRTVCDETDIAGLNRGPLAMGLLTGKFSTGSQLPADDIRGAGAPWMQYFKDGRPNPAWLERLANIREILTSNGRSLTQGALAWIWGRSERMLPIPGFRTVAQVEENARAMEFGPLTNAQLAEIDAILGRT